MRRNLPLGRHAALRSCTLDIWGGGRGALCGLRPETRVRENQCKTRKYDATRNTAGIRLSNDNSSRF